MSDVRQLVVSGRYESIPAIASFVGEAAMAAGLGESGVFHCQMAVDEACTNVIEHAYGGEGLGDITVSCSIAPGQCEIRVTDQGRPFNPDSVPTPAVVKTLDDIQPGGIGLHLMRQMMDEIRFEFSERGNVLTMVKRSKFEPGDTESGNFPVRQVEPDVWVLSPTGRLDSPNAPYFEQALLNLLEQANVWIVVDMERVTYISSRGLKALVKAWRKTRGQQTGIVLCSLKESVWAVFDTVGFTELFPIQEALDDALQVVNAHRG